METPNNLPHTPTPWNYEGGDNHSVEISIGDTTASITRSDKNTGEYVISRDEMCANAEFIVTACNSYASTQKALQEKEELIKEMGSMLKRIYNKTKETGNPPPPAILSEIKELLNDAGITV